ncbi:MAG: AraC family transcriptional regulator [Paenibacillus sp.]|jgi:AraC-like DNA-binding protein|uniref:Helix-turn-helix domain-containing protein n=1 Tax=Paenibacillus hemerocallicola TaxID=1172614 RepID=A0A5C4T464_9BACL|nr:AraC family transcriptional regulator [Paenibacillus hemerocallicola]MDF2659620.1 AraC family transcriptional regulator [Paenibacillus sp.]TNJ63646.1 helix-turn-helix domain-containing protein [Paenibacillus hemerocallicola]
MKFYNELNQSQFKYNYRLTRGHFDTFHMHHGMEFLFIFAGSLLLVVENRIHHVGPGTLVLLQPFQLHRVEPDLEKDYERTVLIFDPYYMENRLQPYPQFHRFFQYLWKEKLPVQIIRHPMIEQLFQHGRDYLFNGNVNDERSEQLTFFVKSVLQSLNWIWNTLDQAAASTPSLRSNHYAECIMKWIDQHFHEELSLEQLAALVHLSPYHLSRLFHEATGSKISEHITARRIREACFLLKTGSTSIKEIGERIGFPNFSYFCRIFRKHTGMSPREYREIY